jgi:hypothetical protein
MNLTDFPEISLWVRHLSSSSLSFQLITSRYHTTGDERILARFHRWNLGYSQCLRTYHRWSSYRAGVLVSCSKRFDGDQADVTGDGSSVSYQYWELVQLISDINLPTGGIAFACLFLTLKLNPTRKLTFAQFKQTFDLIGL